MRQGVTVRGRSNALVGVGVAPFALILVAAPVGSGLVRVAWVLLILGLVALAFVRSARMGVTADPEGLVVRNFVSDRQVPWDEVAAIDADLGDNVTGMVMTIVIRRTDDTKLVARGASSYSRRAVERWRAELHAMHLTSAEQRAD